MRFALALLTAFWLGLVQAFAADIPKDPLNSVIWDQMYEQHFAGKKVVFDGAVRVTAPKMAEDQMAVPVSVDARGLTGVERIIVIADLNPIQKILSFEPQQAKPYIAFRFKVEQGTPLRAAALTSDGVWHMGGMNIDAPGGGCSSPALAHGKPDWTARLAEVRGKIWRHEAQSSARLKLRIQHPMDTGLADGIPAFYIEELEIKDGAGTALGRLELLEPVAENPVVTLMPNLGPDSDRLIVTGRDTDANLISAIVPVPLRSSAIGAARRHAAR